MTFVISQGCCRDASCVSVCPVQCIRPRPGDPEFESAEQLYIDPAVCIDCGACVEECPVDAIHPGDDLPAHLGEYLGVNAEYFANLPEYDRIPVRHRRPRPAADAGELRVAVVGAGPAACYAITDLATTRNTVVNVFDRLPTPFGLVRAGVAPDHPRTKLIGERFGKVLARPNVHCYFNVDVGTDISVAELLEYHHAVLFATGAQEDRRLGVPGEDLPGSHAATDLVAWYNGRPDHAADVVDLSGERAVIIGNGNVALDIARVLTRDPDELARTDIADHAVEALRQSKIREVVIVGRRGPESIACSAGELGELAALDGVDLTATCDAPEPEADPARRRRARILGEAARRAKSPGHKQVELRFRAVPTAIEGVDRVEGVTFADGEFLPASLVIRAIGHVGRAIEGVPFDEATGTIPSERGRVGGGLYCAGWVKRGPSGVIGSNKADAEESVGELMADFSAGRLTAPVGTNEDLAALLTERVPDTVDIRGWRRIDALERETGRDAGRPRVKLVTVAEMLAASRAR